MLISVFVSLIALAESVFAVPVSPDSDYGSRPPACFPFGTYTLNPDLSPPRMAPEQWWCPQSMVYGFLGFSRAFGYQNYDDTFAAISADMAAQKRDFGATMMRMYIPQSYRPELWENVIRAAVANNMGVVLQVAFPIDGSSLSLFNNLVATLYQVLDMSPYKEIAPYVFFAAEFGNESVGDCDFCAAGSTGVATEAASAQNFTSQLASFRSHMNQLGIKAGISEDWDRPGLLSGATTGSDGLGIGLAPLGQAVAKESDFIHAHAMAYYHNIPIQGAWNYTMNQVLWYKKYLPSYPLIISEIMWASGYNTLHAGGDVTGFAVAEVSVADFIFFWETMDENCPFFKQQNTGWFLGFWYEEGTLDMVQYDGSYVMPNFRPKKWC